MKKQIKIIAAILIGLLILLSALLSFLFYSNKQILPTRETINFPYLSAKADYLFYENGKGEFKKWDLKNNKVYNAIKFPFKKIVKIEYSTDGSEALVVWVDPLNESNSFLWLIDMERLALVKQIGENIYNAKWSQNGQIAILTTDEPSGEYTISLMDKNGDNKKAVIKDVAYNTNFFFQDKTRLVYFNVPYENVNSKIYLYNIGTGKTDLMTSDLIPFDGQRYDQDSFVVVTGGQVGPLYKINFEKNLLQLADSVASDAYSINEKKEIIAVQLDEKGTRLIKINSNGDLKVIRNLSSKDIFIGLKTIGEKIFLISGRSLLKY